MSLLHLGGASIGDDKLYVEDVFSTYLYTGNGSTQTINNGIDLAGKGGMVWFKQRGGTTDHWLTGTSMGFGQAIRPNNTGVQQTLSGVIGTVTSTGFTVGAGDSNGPYGVNGSGMSMVSWTFRKAPKFFDVVTYTGNGVAGRQIPHNLGCEVGMVIVKCTSASDDWIVYSRPLGSTKQLYLNKTDAQSSYAGCFGEMTTTYFTVSPDSALNASGRTYVAYLFAHDTSADGIIQCGSFSSNTTTTVGWEPQWMMIKRTDSTGDWITIDNMRGCSVGGIDAVLFPNLSNAESVANDYIDFTPTGFISKNLTGTYIYTVIRRPNKVPTSGTEVYNAAAYTGDNSNTRVISTGFPPDMVWTGYRASGTRTVMNRLTGLFNNPGPGLYTSSTAGEQFPAYSLPQMTGYQTGNGTVRFENSTGIDYVLHAFKRAKGFFDVVCHTLNTSVMNIPHSLGVPPELAIIKRRDGVGDWYVTCKLASGLWTRSITDSAGLKLNTNTEGLYSPYNKSGYFTNTTFNVGAFDSTTLYDVNGKTFVTYLFASLAGVSKVSSYNGNGTSQTIPCGFTTGARFIMIRKLGAGDWYIWDTSRGIVAANDPHLSLNTTSAEVTTDDSIDPESSGFIVNQNTATNINTNGYEYMFLAIA